MLGLDWDLLDELRGSQVDDQDGGFQVNQTLIILEVEEVHHFPLELR